MDRAALLAAGHVRQGSGVSELAWAAWRSQEEGASTRHLGCEAMVPKLGSERARRASTTLAYRRGSLGAAPSLSVT